MNTPKTPEEIGEIIESKNYYYAQGLGSKTGYASYSTVIIANNKKDADEIGKKWQQDKGFRELHLYKNNYKRDCRQMLSQGNYYPHS